MSKAEQQEQTPSKEGGNPVIRWQEIDLTAAAAAGKLSPAFEVDAVIEQLAEVLTSGRIPVLTGESGVGKTAVVHELVRRSQSGQGPGVLNGRAVVQYSIQRIATSLRNPQQIGSEIHKLLDALGGQMGAADGIAPFFRDFHFAHQLHLSPSFESLALRAAGPMLCESDAAAYARMLEDNPDLQQFYVQVSVEEPAPECVQRIVEAWAAEQGGGARAGGRGVRCGFEARALEAAVALSHRFLTRDRQPRKVIDLLRQVGAIVGAGRQAGETDVIERFCRTHSVPRVLVDPAMPLDLGELERRFASELLGQPEAVEALINVIAMVKAGLSDFRRPFGVFMFVGPTGVGKTHAAQLLAEYLFGGRDRVVRLNMADHADDTAAATLFGDPDGYRLPQQRGVLTAKLSGKPFAVLLLDEFEKASPRVHDRFLQLFDEGAFINALGETVNCRSMIIIATSNAGAEVYRSQAFGLALHAAGEKRSRDAEVDHALEKQFRWEFLNRFDRIVHYHPLSRADIRTIALRELAMLKTRFGLRQRQLELEIDESLLDWLAVNGYDPDNGARFLRRTIERHVVTAVADTIVRENPAPGSGRAMVLTVRAGKVAARLSPEGGGNGAGVEPKMSVLLPGAAAKKPAKLDGAGVRAEARTVVEGAEGLLAGLERRRGERSVLLEQMNQAEFWADREKRGTVLDRFRELDVAVRAEERLAAPIVRLRDMLRESATGAAPALARQLELAAEALREWDHREGEEGASALWLVIGSADPTQPAPEWVGELTEMELAWCRRLHLSAEVAAVEAGEGGAAVRTVVSVDGPAAGVLMEMEAGLHRLRRPRQRDAKARIDVVVRGAAPSQLWPSIRKAGTRGGTRGTGGPTPMLRAAWQGDIELPGRTVTLQAAARDVLSHLLADLAAAWSGGVTQEPPLARVYGEEGGLVRDVRLSDAAGVKIKDALRGRLEPLLEAWRERPRGAGV